ncbi:hypothetical protein BH24DEI1_BH24DEI1_01870 [soil metagenome]|jgi:hypothetical protein|nr:hypothetical protein [Deinococcota bacterium]
MPTSVAVIWAVTLVIAYLAVPIVVVLLLRIARAARKIELYTRETRLASQGISGHLEAVVALEQTESLLTGAHAVGGDIALGAEAMAGLLSRRAGADG